MPVLCVIPARLGSTRLPQKPLRLLAGRPLIQHVVERVLAFDLDAAVVVATDDVRVARAAEACGVAAAMTAAGHRSGTERVAEVSRRAEYAGFDTVLNVQGDEPFLSRAAVSGALARVSAGDAVGTAAGRLAPADLANPHRVKVTVNGSGHATGFTRRAVAGALHHVGVYACRRDALLAWVAAPPVPAEAAERLEQLRPLALGMALGVAVLDECVPGGIDTEDDLVLADAGSRVTVSHAPRGARGSDDRGEA